MYHFSILSKHQDPLNEIIYLAHRRAWLYLDEGRLKPPGDHLMKVHRRRMLQACGALFAGTVVPAWAADLVATPAQMRGPFYPLSLPLDQDNDLVSVSSRSG